MGNLPLVDSKEMGMNIRRLMRLKHKTITQVQIELGFSSATNIYKWCRGESIPSLDHLVQLASILDCSLNDIVVTNEDSI